MAPRDLLKGRIRPSKHDDEFEERSESDSGASTHSDEGLEDHNALPAAGRGPIPTSSKRQQPNSQDDGDEGSESSSDDSEDETSSSPPAGPANPTANITFGALASAAASLGQQKKRKRSSHPDRASRSPSPFHEAAEREYGAKARSARPARSSQHAPTELTSKRAVSRKRSVVHIPATAARDPRFSSLSGAAPDANLVEKKWKFLDEYRASELAQLKKEMREAKEPARKDALKRDVKKREDRERTRKKAEREREVLREHKRAEREKIRQGKRPYFMNKGEVKQAVLEKQYQELGPKKAEKVMERRRRKQAAKEKREMPWARRGQRPEE